MSSSRKMLLKSYDAFCNSPPARVTKVFSLTHGENWTVKRTVNSNGLCPGVNDDFGYCSHLISHSIIQR